MKSAKEGILLNKINSIKECLYQRSIPLNEWQTRVGLYEAPGKYQIEDEAWKPTHVGDTWEGKDDVTRWFKCTVDIPEEFKGQKLILDIEVGGEGLVTINGEIRSAITSYLTPNNATRTRVVIPEHIQANSSMEVLVEAGLNYMEFARFRARGAKSVTYLFRKAALAVVNPKVESYYFDALVTYEALQVLGGNLLGADVRTAGIRIPKEIQDMLSLFSKDGLLHDKVLEALEDSLALVDFDFDRERLVASLDEAQKKLWEKLDAISYTPEAAITFTGHSHIDTAWLWPIKETVRKCSRTFSNTIALMEEYPEHIFTQSQPQLFAYTKEHYPELYTKIKEKVAEGRWELIGNTWVECDTNVPSGEALVRQILYGRDFFKKEFGKLSKVYWMPDVFGYSWALPQIIKRSGMDYFYTSKLINNDTNRFPYTMFWWQGIDGTKVLSYLQRVNYNGNIHPVHMHQAWDRFDEKECHNEAMITYGYGDGGGGPTYEMLEYSKRLKNFPGLPASRIENAETFFENAGENARNLPTWFDEMYYEYHRGTYTSQARNKRNNRKSELLYRQAEMASVVAEKMGLTYPIEQLTYGWKLILLNQFHDIIPGSSINEVYRDCEKDYAEILAIGHQAEEKALQAITDHMALEGEGKVIVVFNYLSWDRTDVVELKLSGADTDMILVDSQGFALPCNIKETDDGYMTLSFEARNVPSMGYASYRLIPAKKETKVENSIIVTESLMENQYYRIELDAQGNMSRIYDKKAGREVLAQDGYGNVLQIFEDRPGSHSSWNIDIEYQKKGWDINDVKLIQVVEAGPARGVLRVVKTFNQSEITQDIIVYAANPRIDFKTEVDWQETEKLLKAAFTVDVLSTKASYEIAFGSIERPTHWNTSWDKARFEVPAHKWADLSEGGYGVSILNDCKYGYDIKDNVMRITLLKAPIYPDPVADKGHQEFSYSLYPHEGDWKQGDVVHAGYGLNVPLRAVIAEASRKEGLPAVMSFVRTDSPNVIIDTLKAAEDGDGIILRVYESCGQRGQVTVQTRLDVTEAVECNLVEENEESTEMKNGTFRFHIKPFEIKTFRLK